MTQFPLAGDMCERRKREKYFEEQLAACQQELSSCRHDRAQLLAELETLRHAPSSQPRPTISLSPREHAVLIRLSRGLTNPEIARELRMSLSTVKTHVQHILRKLGTTDRTRAAVRAVESGVLDGN